MMQTQELATRPEAPIESQAVGALMQALKVRSDEARRLIEGSATLAGTSPVEVSRMLVADPNGRP